MKVEAVQEFFIDKDKSPVKANVREYQRTSNTTKFEYGGWDLFKPSAYIKNSDGMYSNIPSPKVKLTNEAAVQTQSAASQSTPISTARTKTVKNANGSSSTTRSVEVGAKSNSGIPVKATVSRTVNSNGRSSSNVKVSVGYDIVNGYFESGRSEDNNTYIRAGVQSTVQSPNVGGYSVGSETTIQVSKEKR